MTPEIPRGVRATTTRRREPERHRHLRGKRNGQGIARLSRESRRDVDGKGAWPVCGQFLEDSAQRLPERSGKASADKTVQNEINV
jgi:hypothetical protein